MTICATMVYSKHGASAPERFLPATHEKKHLPLKSRGIAFSWVLPGSQPMAKRRRQMVVRFLRLAPIFRRIRNRLYHFDYRLAVHQPAPSCAIIRPMSERGGSFSTSPARSFGLNELR